MQRIEVGLLLAVLCYTCNAIQSPNLVFRRGPEVDHQQQPSSDIPASYGPFQAPAETCTKDKCKLPRCRCSGTDIPGDLNVTATPQMVLLSFQTAVNDQNYPLYTKLFQSRKNPNGCPRTGTFYVSHNYSDYWEVQNLYAGRHEIGVNTVTSPRPPLTRDQWTSQIISEEAILNRWARIAIRDIHGFRAPYLAPGGDDMMDGVKTAVMQYDSSLVTIKYADSGNLLWPYTLDYASTQDCVVAPCPRNSHPGIWELPLMAWKDRFGRVYAVPAACNVTTEDQAYTLLSNKFQSHYKSQNRAPLGIPLDTSWLVTDYKMKGTQRFLDELDKYKDVYTVTKWQALQWIAKPTPLSGLKSFPAWQCKASPPSVCSAEQALRCQFDKDRRLIPRGGTGTPVYNLHTCASSCPKCYPSLGDPYGQQAC